MEATELPRRSKQCSHRDRGREPIGFSNNIPLRMRGFRRRSGIAISAILEIVVSFVSRPLLPVIRMSANRVLPLAPGCQADYCELCPYDVR